MPRACFERAGVQVFKEARLRDDDGGGGFCVFIVSVFLWRVFEATPHPVRLIDRTVDANSGKSIARTRCMFGACMLSLLSMRFDVYCIEIAAEQRRDPFNTNAVNAVNKMHSNG